MARTGVQKEDDELRRESTCDAFKNQDVIEMENY